MLSCKCLTPSTKKERGINQIGEGFSEVGESIT